MVHGGIAHHHRIGNIQGRTPGLRAQAPGQVVQRLNDHPAQLFRALRLPDGMADARHHVLAVGDLRVHRPGSGQRLAAFQVNQVAGQLGGAQVHRQPQRGSARRAHAHEPSTRARRR